LTGIPVPELERLNPELLRGVTPPDISEYILRIPKGKAEAFAAVYESIPTEKASSWTRHRVRRGETLSSIARKYGVSLSAVLDANKIGRSRRIYAGQTLTIPVPALRSAAKSKPASLAANSARRIVKESPDKYLVREGDTLWEIAEAYGVSIGDIKRLNGISSNSLYAGHWLRIPASGQAGSNDDPVVTYDTYRVRRGDNLTRIAIKHGTTVEAIKGANNMRSSTIYPGMSLKIPARTSTNAQYDFQNSQYSNNLTRKIYTVKTGDTLWRIARAHGVGISDLAKWNNLTIRSKLYPGDKLKIYYN